MTGIEDCPLPEVAEALGPFIKPRDEVAKIRQELQSHLAKQLASGAVPLSSASLSNHDVIRPPGPSSALSGVRNAYLKALQAHATAQARYDALKADLSRLSSPEVNRSTVTNQSSSSVGDSYIPLLRQREKQRRLKVIERAFTQINAAGEAATNGHLDDIVRQRAGDVPTPPTAPAPAFNEKPDVESRILQLKKAILATKRRIDNSSAPAQANGTIGSRPRSEVAGLQSALNELTGWMEQQLAVIGEADTETPSVPPTPGVNGHGVPEVASIEDIGALYEQYLAVRQRLIETVNTSPASTVDPGITTTSNGSAVKEAEQRPTPAEVLLPYLQTLTTTKQEEQSLLQQSAHLRRQISSSEAETARLIARLADESHLVHPGAAYGKDWAEAGSESSRATKDFARRHFRAGEASADAAQKALGNIEDVPKMFDALARRTS